MMKNKKILLLSYSFRTGGSEILCLKVAKYLKQKNYDIRVISTHLGRGNLSEQLDAIGVKSFALNNQKNKRLVSYLLLIRFLIFWKPEVVYAQHLTTAALLFPVLKLFRVKKIIVTEHTDYEFKQYPRFQKMAKKYFNKMDLITVIHPGLLQYFSQQFNISETKIVMIPNGINLSTYSVNKEQFLARSIFDEKKARPVIIGWVGRIHPQKNLIGALETVLLLNEKTDRKFILKIVGEGDQQEECRQFVENKKIGHLVDFIGRHDNVSQVLKSVDIYFSSSITEGVPFTMLEAQACSCPVVMPKVGGIEYFIDEGETGYLYDAGDFEKAAEIIESLMLNPDKAKKVALSAAQYAKDFYDDDEIMAKYESKIVSI